MGRVLSLRLGRGLLVALVVLVLAPTARGDDAVVFAAASLTDVLRELAVTWHTRHGDHLVLTFGASSDLARQIRAGAPAAVFFSADTRRMEDLEKEGLVAPGSRHDTPSNQLAVVVPAGSAAVVNAPEDLRSFRRIALADPDAVPAGVYAKTWLVSIGLWDAIREKVVPMSDVRAALVAVEAEHADAGIVYQTDARVTKRVRAAYTVPRDAGPPILYSVAALAGHPEGREVVHFLVSRDAVPVYEQYGFVVVETR